MSVTDRVMASLAALIKGVLWIIAGNGERQHLFYMYVSSWHHECVSHVMERVCTMNSLFSLKPYQNFPEFNTIGVHSFRLQLPSHPLSHCHGWNFWSLHADCDKFFLSKMFVNKLVGRPHQTTLTQGQWDQDPPPPRKPAHGKCTRRGPHYKQPKVWAPKVKRSELGKGQCQPHQDPLLPSRTRNESSQPDLSDKNSHI